MWTQPWKFREGLSIGVGLTLVGLLLQYTIGPVQWDMVAAPLNIILGLLFVGMLSLCYALRNRSYAIRWHMTQSAAVPAIALAALLTLLLGLGNWLSMLRHWSFVLSYSWMLFIIGLVVIRRICNFGHSGRWVRDVSFVLNHLGLFIALICGTLGNADMQRLKMTTEVGRPEWRGIDETTHQIKEPSLSIELLSFTIDEYPPQQIIIDNENGNVIEAETAGWQIEILETLENAACVTSDSTETYFVEWQSTGATTAQRIRATRGDKTVEGWISCGSFMYPYTILELDEHCSLIMPEREPKRYASEVTVSVKDGEQVRATIEVNHPLEIEGWKIYQVDYDENMGRWSNISVFELVRDPWLPFVYLGIFMMLGGAVLLFLSNDKMR